LQIINHIRVSLLQCQYVSAVRHARPNFCHNSVRDLEYVLLLRLTWRDMAVGALPLEEATVTNTSRNLPVFALGEASTA